MLAFRGMNAGRRLRAAGFTAFIASFLAMNCGEQEFNLLPLEQENARGGSTTGGEENSGGFGLVPPPQETGGTFTGGRPSAGGRGSTGGTSGGRGGMSSGPPTCEPPVCCATNEDCFDDRRPFCLMGGVCQECFLDASQDYKSIGCAENEVCAGSYRCVPGCANTLCPGDFKCAPNKQCVECLQHEDCSQNEYRKLCWAYACVACRSDADCPGFMTCNQFNTCV